MRNPRLLGFLIAAPICVLLTRLWTEVDAGFWATLAFFLFLALVVAPLGARLAGVIARR